MVHAVIMAGGSGTRFWPKSSKRHPKQFLALCGKRTMIQLTADRLKGVVAPKNTWIVTHKDFTRHIRRQLPAVPAPNILKEPEARNTMAALCMSAYRIRAVDPDGIMLCLPADHFIGDVSAFQKTLRLAIEVAQKENRIVVIGMRPSYPATGFGYVEQGSPLSQGVHEVSHFFEKPSHAKATEFLNAGRYFWNAGLFIVPVRLFISETEKLAPEFSKIFQKWNFKEASLPRLYKQLPKLPVDIAIMEKTNRGALIPGDFGWNDLGSWPSLLEVQKQASDIGLINAGGHFAIDTKNMIVESPGKFVAMIGVENLVVVETEDALLICSLDRAQEIKKVVEHLEKSKLKTLA